MQCKCGGIVVDQTHVVKKLTTAKRWVPDIDVVPVMISRPRCQSCGRQGRVIWWPTSFTS